MITFKEYLTESKITYKDLKTNDDVTNYIRLNDHPRDMRKCEVINFKTKGTTIYFLWYNGEDDTFPVNQIIKGVIKGTPVEMGYTPWEGEALLKTAGTKR